MTWKWSNALLGNVNRYVLYLRKTTEISQLVISESFVAVEERNFKSQPNLTCNGKTDLFALQLLTGQKLVPVVCPSCYSCYFPHCQCHVKCLWCWYWSFAVDIHWHWKIISHFLAPKFFARGLCLQRFTSQDLILTNEDLCRALRSDRSLWKGTGPSESPWPCCLFPVSIQFVSGATHC